MPSVEVRTSMGSFVIDLHEDKAPKTVANFLSYVDAGHYSGTIFHRVIRGFMVQGGGYDSSMTKKPVQPPVTNEGDNGLKNKRGTVAMARTSEPHSATSQFFVNHGSNGFLDHSDKTARGWGYAVFGTVTSGMDVVDDIAAQETGAKGPFRKDAPQQDVVIEAVERL